MNLLCPNCQKMLSVPEQYAGQLMKCPTCQGTFTVPNLPAGGTSDLIGMTPGPAPSSGPPAVAPPPPDVYGVQHEPISMTPPPPPPPPPPQGFSSGSVPLPSQPPDQLIGYTHHSTVYFSERVLQFVPAVAAVLVFFLSFFAWVGLFPGGQTALTQSAWGIAFGGTGADDNLGPMNRIKRTAGVGSWISKEEAKSLEDDLGISFLMMLYLFLGFLTLLVSVAVVAYPFLQGKVQIPPVVLNLLPLRWAIVVGLHVLVFLLLLLQLVFTFPLESKVSSVARSRYDALLKENSSSTAKADAAVMYGMITEEARRTYALETVVILHILAILSAGLVFWVDKRGPAYPTPKLEVAW
jgi:hypothetical protein